MYITYFIYIKCLQILEKQQQNNNRRAKKTPWKYKHYLKFIWLESKNIEAV